MTRTRKKDTIGTPAPVNGVNGVNGKIRPHARMTELAPEAALGARPANPPSPGSSGRVWTDDIDDTSVEGLGFGSPRLSSTGLAGSTGTAGLAGFDSADYGFDGSDDSPDFPDLSAIGRLGPGLSLNATLAVELGWAQSLRRFAKVTTWALPAATACFALAGMWGWPKSSSPAPATWLAVDVVGLVFTLVGFLALTALLAPTLARPWALVALYTMLCGAVFVAPVLGLLGVARPSLTREAGKIGANTATNLQNALFDATVSRWLGVCGLVLIAVAFFALACAVAASGVLNRNDGFLLLGADAIAVAGAYLAWQFLLVIAAMVALAATLGISWTAARLSPSGRPPVADS